MSTNSFNNDDKKKWVQNIKQHRIKLQQYFERIDDTEFIPKVIVSKKSNLNNNDKPNTASKVPKYKLEPNVKVFNTKTKLSVGEVKVEEEPLSNVEITDPDFGPKVLKGLKEQLMEEEQDISFTSEESDDNISVGMDEDWNDNISVGMDEDWNGKKKKSRCTKRFRYDRKQSKDKCNSPNYSKSSNTKTDYYRTNIKNRDLHNAIERECRKRIASLFVNLGKVCTNLKTSRQIPTKISILLTAKKDCDKLKRDEKKMKTTLNALLKNNKALNKRLNELKANK